MHSLGANTSVALVKWPSIANRMLVETHEVYARIPGYPGLWQLYNETTGVQLARPVDGGYLVYYDRTRTQRSVIGVGLWRQFNFH
jgi:hypothetical protein